jgi:hypothetical protein
MKKIVRLTESDITRIVKRVMNESPLLLGDPDYKSDYRDSYEDDDDNLSDEEFMSKYRNKDIPGWDTPHSEKRIDRELSDKEFYEKYKNKYLGWDVPHNQKRNRMSSIKSKGFRK